MSKVAILTDSNSGITQEEAKQAGIYVFPTPVYINDEVFYEGVDLTTDQFFARQAEGGSEEHTSELQSPITISYAVFCLKKIRLLLKLCLVVC